jgi:hypothetical protein
MPGFWDLLLGREAPKEPPAIEEAKAEPPPLPAAPAAADKPDPDYSIDDAIELMRTLPLGPNADLVLRVVRKTLESTNVSVDDIIGEGTARERSIETDIADREMEIVRLEAEIAAKREHIKQRTKDLDETRLVRQRLEQALANRTQARPAFVVQPEPEIKGAPSTPPTEKPPAPQDGEEIVTGDQVESIPPS